MPPACTTSGSWPPSSPSAEPPPAGQPERSAGAVTRLGPSAWRRTPARELLADAGRSGTDPDLRRPAADGAAALGRPRLRLDRLERDRAVQGTAMGVEHAGRLHVALVADAGAVSKHAGERPSAARRCWSRAVPHRRRDRARPGSSSVCRRVFTSRFVGGIAQGPPTSAREKCHMGGRGTDSFVTIGGAAAALIPWVDVAVATRVARRYGLSARRQ